MELHPIKVGVTSFAFCLYILIGSRANVKGYVYVLSKENGEYIIYFLCSSFLLFQSQLFGYYFFIQSAAKGLNIL